MLMAVLAVGVLDAIAAVSTTRAGASAPELAIYARLVSLLLGLMVVENLWRNTPRDHAWSMKHLCLGVLALFVYDVFLNADALLFKRFDPELWAARGILNAVAVPFIALSAIRNPTLSLPMHVSRDVVFYSTTLFASGVYFVLVSFAGFYIRRFGGDWGDVVSIVVLGTSAMGAVALLGSSSLRSRVRLFINQNFFSYKYDYRKEWARLIDTIASDTEHTSLHRRVIKGMADLVDSPSGALWIAREGEEALVGVAEWHRKSAMARLAFRDPLFEWFERGQRIVNLRDPASLPADHPDGPIASWLGAVASAWLVIPLINRERMIGMIVLDPPRADHDLNWEDYTLLKLAGRQIASYIAEEEAMNALTDAQRLEEFNKRFAFVVHDIKNIVGQLSLLVRNAERFGDNPEFQRDLLETLRNSVDKMRALLDQLNRDRAAAAERTVDLVPVVEAFVRGWHVGDRRVEFARRVPRAAVRLKDEEKVHRVLSHLVQNAVDATPPEGCVTVSIDAGIDDATLDVVDQGPGMDEEFIRTELFRPFRTTKTAGMGIGAFQTRELVRELGGRLDVVSAPGRGTTMRVRLPLVEHAPVVEAARHG
jgi:putative PEP-CTERM system histidine kinase